MNIRTTPLSISQSTVFNLRARNSQLATNQLQLSSGLRFQRPSEDPSAFAELSFFRREISALSAESANISDAESQLNFSVAQLQQVNEILVNAKQIALQGRQAVDQTERNALATQVEKMLERLLATVNASDKGKYLYGGAANTAAPFELQENGNGNGSPRANYLGSHTETETVVSASINVTTRHDGSQIFFRSGRGESIFMGSTGAAAGSGKDTGIGQATLQIVHFKTNYVVADGSGVARGVSSDAGDTLIGNAAVHAVQIVDLVGDGSAGTIALNGGEPVAFTNADNDLKVVGPKGEIVYVDTTNITPGFAGTNRLSSLGKMSTDGGQTFTDIDYSNNQIVRNSVNGEITNVDTSAVRSVGTTQIDYADTSDVFTTLMQLRDELVNKRQLNGSDWNQAFERRLSDLDVVTEQAWQEMGEQSSDLQNLQRLKTRNEDIRYEMETMISGREAVDYADAVTRLQEGLNQLQFTYASFASILQQSILNHL